MVREDLVREVIVEDIIKRELDMFSNVRMVSPSQAKEKPESFAQARRIGFSVLSTETLKSYHGDLLNAEREGKNLVELRYGRADNLIGCLNINPIIDEIVEIEKRWIADLASRQQQLTDGTSMLEKTFDLRCELETYSDNTLLMYYDDVTAAEAAGRNLAEERSALAMLI